MHFPPSEVGGVTPSTRTCMQELRSLCGLTSADRIVAAFHPSADPPVVHCDPVMPMFPVLAVTLPWTRAYRSPVNPSCLRSRITFSG